MRSDVGLQSPTSVVPFPDQVSLVTRAPHGPDYGLVVQPREVLDLVEHQLTELTGDHASVISCVEESEHAFEKGPLVRGDDLDVGHFTPQDLLGSAIRELPPDSSTTGGGCLGPRALFNQPSTDPSPH